MRSAAILAAALSPSATRAFTAPPSTMPRTTTASPTLHATVASAELNTMTKEEQLAMLGIDSQEKLALGIEPDEVLEYIGT